MLQEEASTISNMSLLNVSISVLNGKPQHILDGAFSTSEVSQFLHCYRLPLNHNIHFLRYPVQNIRNPFIMDDQIDLHPNLCIEGTMLLLPQPENKGFRSSQIQCMYNWKRCLQL